MVYQLWEGEGERRRGEERKKIRGREEGEEKGEGGGRGGGGTSQEGREAASHMSLLQLQQAEAGREKMP